MLFIIYNIYLANIDIIIRKVEDICKEAYEVIFRKKLYESSNVKVDLDNIFIIFSNISLY